MAKICKVLVVEDHDGIRISPVYKPPGDSGVLDPRLMASDTDDRHRPRLRHPERLAHLKLPQQIAGLQPGRAARTAVS